MGEEISTVAWVRAVADIFDALISDRPHRKAMPCAKSLRILRKEAKEAKLDKEVVGNLEMLVIN